MNSTNRVANRIVLLVVGAVLLAAGAVGVGVAVLPDGDRLWHRQAVEAASLLDRAAWIDLTRIGIPRVPWFLLAIPAAAAVLIVVLLVFVFAQGRGRLGRVTDGRRVADSPAEGFLSVDVDVARDAIRRAARGIRGVSEPSVSAYRVRGGAALKVTVNVADGVDPASVVPPLEAAVLEWDELLGERGPVYVHLIAGVGAIAPLRALVPGRREPSLVE